MITQSDDLGQILEGINGLYKVVNDFRFELESLGSLIREKIDKADAAVLADEALKGNPQGGAPAAVDKDGQGELAIF